MSEANMISTNEVSWCGAQAERRSTVSEANHQTQQDLEKAGDELL
jgi:hypothetical protein